MSSRVKRLVVRVERCGALSGLGSGALILGLGFLGLGLGAGCAPVPTSRPIPDEDMEAKLPDLRETAEAEPGSAEAQAAYGLTLYLLGQYDAAAEPLARSVAIDPEQTTVRLVAADVHRRGGRYSEAEALLDDLPLAAPSDSVLVASARERVLRSKLTEQASQALSESVSVDSETLAAHRIAVFDLEGSGGEDGGGSVEDARVEAVGAALAFQLAQYLDGAQGSTDLEVVDRVRQQSMARAFEEGPEEGDLPAAPPLQPLGTGMGLQQRLQMLPTPGPSAFYQGTLDGVVGPGTQAAVRRFQEWAGLSADGIAGPQTRERLNEEIQKRYSVVPPAARERSVADLARALGARRLLEGRVWTAGDAEGNERLNVRVEVLDVVDGAIVATAATERPWGEVVSIPPELVQQLIGELDPELGWVPPGEEPDWGAWDAAARTEAFIEFGMGLLDEDAGRWEEASVHFETAADRAPEWADASRRAVMTSIASQDFQDRVYRVTRSLTSF